MRSNRRVRLAGAAVVLTGVVIWLAVSPGQSQDARRIETRIYATPEYKTDAARAIDAYERVMERYMDVTERNFIAISADIRAVDTKLDAIDAKLTKLDTRLERIERHLGTVPIPTTTRDPNRPRIIAPQSAGTGVSMDR